MSNSKLIEAARKAKGSRILPTVLLGQRYDAEELLLAMADALQACEWNTDMEAAPRDGTNIEGWNKSHGAHQCWARSSIEAPKRPVFYYGKHGLFIPTTWRPITTPDETQ